jgi:hypothetical protein
MLLSPAVKVKKSLLRRKALLLVLFVAGSINCSSQNFSWTDNCYKAYTEAAKLNFSRAQQYAAAEKKINPKNLVIPYVESQSDFIKCFVSENIDDLQTLKKKNEERISQVEDSKIESPYKRVFLAEYNLQMAVARLKFEEHIGAVYETRKAFRLLQENRKLYPDFKPTLRSLGFIHAFVGGTPKNYQWMLSLLGFKGTIQQGLDEVRELLAATYKQQELAYLRDETIVMLTFLEMNLAKDKNNDQIRKRFYGIADPGSKPLIVFAKGVFHIANAENDSVLLLLSALKTPEDSYRLYYLDYMEGNARLNNLDYTAESSFKKYISNFKGKTFLKSAHQRMAWIRLLQGDEKGYKEYIKLAGNKQTGSTFTDEDKQAVTEANSGEIPNGILLKSRLLFDGGYYQRSLGEIAGKPVDAFPTLRDKLEFTYRLARIFDKTGKKEKAIQYYGQTIENGKSFKFYFAANSALQLGLLYEEKGDLINAEKYFRLCLSLPEHEYQNSLDQKAKAGLNRIGK